MNTRLWFFLLAFSIPFGQIFSQTKNQADLVDLLTIIPSLVLDIRYATENNFTKTKLYPTAKAKLRREAAESLSAIQRDLEQSGLRLKVFDAYRPLSIQRKLWEFMPNEDFVANPSKGSRHNRGAAVDLTIIDSTGNEIAMPTPYDDFTIKARQDYMDLSDSVLHNRALLTSVMMRHGFSPLKTEWWHYDFSGWERYEILDEPLQ